RAVLAADEEQANDVAATHPLAREQPEERAERKEPRERPHIGLVPVRLQAHDLARDEPQPRRRSGELLDPRRVVPELEERAAAIAFAVDRLVAPLLPRLLGV